MGDREAAGDEQTQAASRARGDSRVTVYELAVALRDYASELPVRVRSADGGPVVRAGVVAVVEEDGAACVLVVVVEVEGEGECLPGYGRGQS